MLIKKPIIFLGPTLDYQMARKHLDALYLAPAKQGDILSCVMTYKPNIIGLVDGEFYQSLSVWHKEILFALDNRIQVYGSSSMGALRAAELTDFGMIGVGEIFEKYKNGTINNDDEVALIYGDKSINYKGLSLPLVNIRATIQKLKLLSLIDHETAEELINIASSLYFPERCIQNILQIFHQKIGEAGDKVFKLKQAFQSHYVDLKQLDALKLLDTIAKSVSNHVWRDIDIKNIEKVGSFYNHERSVSNSKGNITVGELANFVALDMKGFASFNFNALNRYVVNLFAQFLNLEITENDIEREIRLFQLSNNLVDETVFQKWLVMNDLTQEEFENIMHETACCKKMHRWAFYNKKMTEKNAKIILDEIKFHSTYESWKNKAIKYKQNSKELLGLSLNKNIKDNKDLKEIFLNYLQHAPDPVWTDIDTWMSESGFQHRLELVHELIKYNAVEHSKISNKRSDSFFSEWIKNNLSKSFDGIVINLSSFIQYGSDNLSESNLYGLIKKVLRSYIFEASAKFHWIIDSIESERVRAITEIFKITEKCNIYNKNINHVFYFNLHDFVRLDDVLLFNNLCSITIRIVLEQKTDVSLTSLINYFINKCCSLSLFINIELIFTAKSLFCSINLENILEKLSGYPIQIILDLSVIKFIQINSENKFKYINYFKGIITRLTAYWLKNHTKLNISNFSEIVNMARRNKDNLSTLNRQVILEDSLLIIDENEDIFLHSKYSLLGAKSDYNFLLGNLKNIDSLEKLHEKISDKLHNQFMMSDQLCKEKCDYYLVCGSKYNIEKYSEFNTFIQTETITCLLMKKTLTEIVLDHLEKFTDFVNLTKERSS